MLLLEISGEHVKMLFLSPQLGKVVIRVKINSQTFAKQVSQSSASFFKYHIKKGEGSEHYKCILIGVSQGLSRPTGQFPIIS